MLIMRFWIIWVSKNVKISVEKSNGGSMHANNFLSSLSLFFSISLVSTRWQRCGYALGWAHQGAHPTLPIHYSNTFFSVCSAVQCMGTLFWALWWPQPYNRLVRVFSSITWIHMYMHAPPVLLLHHMSASTHGRRWPLLAAAMWVRFLWVIASRKYQIFFKPLLSLNGKQARLSPAVYYMNCL